MKDTFSFAGISSETFAVHYQPSASDIFGEEIDTETYNEEIPWRDGGIYYGRRAKKRTITLSCYFEDISARTLSAQNRWLHIQDEEQLVFDRKPWKYYTVRVESLSDTKAYIIAGYGERARYSGTFTVSFAAYTPYARLFYDRYNGIDLEGASKETGMLPSRDMPEEPTAESRRFLIYNCGTERIGAKIRIGGESGKSVVIVNETNGCRCKLNTLPGDGAYLEIDSDKGKVEIVSEATDERTLSFESHDEGYITLESCGAIIKEYVFSYEEGSNIVQCPGQNIPGDEAIDKYVLLCGEWYRIVDLTDGGFIIDRVMTSTGDEASTIATMNVIRIDTEATLNRLEVDYTPMVR